MPSANDASILPFLKRQYPKGIAFSGYKKSKLLSMLEKDTTFGGEGKHYTVQTGPTSGGSADYQTAYANQGPSNARRFFVQHRTEYQLARIKGIAIAKTMGDKNAIKAILTTEFDQAGYAFGRSMAAIVWGNGGGALGKIDATTTLSSTTLRLATRSDLARFEQGMWIQFASDDGSGVSPSGVLAGQRQVLKIKLSGGFAELTLDQAVNTIPGVATGYFIFRAGDYGQKMTGLAGWNPLVAPSGSDSFNSVNRSDHEFRLAGFRYTGNGGSKEATLLDCAAQANAHGSESTMCHVNPIDWNSVQKEVGSDRVVQMNSKVADVGFSTIKLQTAMGEVDLVSEVDVPQGEFFFTNPDQVELLTAGACPKVLNADGQGKLVKVQGDDAYQFDIGAYGNIGVENPINFSHGTF